jgi:predicted AlkP superfamily pyrophosphatase or phosphodiesterase
MIQDCYAKPPELYQRLCQAVGRPFRLRHYWGPLASAKAGDWIAEAAAALLRDPSGAPDLCLTYLPTLDYDLQRLGPDHPRCQAAKEALRRQLVRLAEAAVGQEREVLVFGDYAMQPVRRPVFPNRALLAAGLLAARRIRGMLYPDLHASRAFAMVDHQIAHVYVSETADVGRAAEILSGLDGVGDVLDRARQAEIGLDHPHSGELVLVAQPGSWFAYPWWTQKRQAPDYARHVDIHNKPGYDPCELFFGWPPMSVGQDPAKIRGSHGPVGLGRRIAWAATFPLGREPADLVELAAAAREWLDSE